MVAQKFTDLCIISLQQVVATFNEMGRAEPLLRPSLIVSNRCNFRFNVGFRMGLPRILRCLLWVVTEATDGNRTSGMASVKQEHEVTLHRLMAPGAGIDLFKRTIFDWAIWTTTSSD